VTPLGRCLGVCLLLAACNADGLDVNGDARKDAAHAPVDFSSPRDLANDLPSLATDLALPPCYAIYCDHFESLDAGWMVDGPVALTTGRAYDGLRAMQSTASAPTTLTRSVALAADIYIRAYIYTQPDLDQAVDLFSIASSTNAQAKGTVRYDPGQAQKQAPRISILSGSSSATVSAVIPSGRFVCVEWQLPQANGALWNTVVAIDGGNVARITLTSAPAMYDSLKLGQSSVSTPKGASSDDFWIDDLVVSDSPIGCRS
jgi:hypothetical protein